MERFGLFITGFILLKLGHTNMQGDISSIHWYNRTKVKREDYPKYGRLIGLGGIVTGVTLLCAGLLSFVVESELVDLVIWTGVAAGLILTLYAQFKYNKGIF